MQRTNIKTLNELGRAYKNAKEPERLKFKANLLEYSERDKTDYWRAFRDVWQYSDTWGKTPGCILLACQYVLNVDFKTLTTLQK